MPYSHIWVLIFITKSARPPDRLNKYGAPTSLRPTYTQKPTVNTRWHAVSLKVAPARNRGSTFPHQHELFCGNNSSVRVFELKPWCNVTEDILGWWPFPVGGSCGRCWPSACCEGDAAAAVYVSPGRHSRGVTLICCWCWWRGPAGSRPSSSSQRCRMRLRSWLRAGQPDSSSSALWRPLNLNKRKFFQGCGALFFDFLRSSLGVSIKSTAQKWSRFSDTQNLLRRSL